MAKQAPIVVDGANIAHEEASNGGKPRVINLVVMKDQLEKLGYEPIIIVDASLRHDIDDQAQLEAMMDRKVVRQAPAGTEADYFVLTTAQELDALVVSNDRYDSYQEQFPWIRKRRIPFMIINGSVQLYWEEKLDLRNGPGKTEKPAPAVQAQK